MKAISIWQPWASLIAIGAKRYETRSWLTTYRGPIAIHASKTKTFLNDLKDGWLPRIDRALADAEVAEISLGAIIAVADLTATYTTENITALPETSKDELAFGDFSSGRYAWELENVVMLEKPIPCRGRQGLWETDRLPSVAGNAPEWLRDFVYNCGQREGGICNGTGEPWDAETCCSCAEDGVR
ncbi:MAG: ASCH domain-containing protein [Candidatus Aquicultorales bacterium]